MGKPRIRKPGDLPEQTTEYGRTGCSAAGWHALCVRCVRAASCPAHCIDAWDTTMSATLHVCITCRAGQAVPEGEACAGKRLHEAVTALEAPRGVRIVPVECLSACSQGCTVALSAPRRWSYVYGRLSEADAADILAGAAAYAEAPDGIVPWRQRPVIFRKQSLARIPPLELA